MAAAIAALADSISIGDLVLEDRAHRSVYTDPQIFDLEMARIFAGSWAYVGHESEVAHPGDYTTCTIGRQPVLHLEGPDADLAAATYHRAAPVVPTRANQSRAALGTGQ